MTLEPGNGQLSLISITSGNAGRQLDEEVKTCCATGLLLSRLHED